MLTALCCRSYGGERLGNALQPRSLGQSRPDGTTVSLGGSRLAVIDVSWNGFQDAGATAVANALAANTSLKRVDLSHNRIEGKGAIAIAESLEENNTIVALNLSHNPLGRVRTLPRL